MVPVTGKEYIMSNLIPGNQKHLTLDNRVFIEKCLDQNMTMKDIAKPYAKILPLSPKRLRNIARSILIMTLLPKVL